MSILLGQRCEIRPAYSMDTGDHSIWDEIAGCECRVIAVRGEYADVQLRNGEEVNVHLGRLRVRWSE